MAELIENAPAERHKPRDRMTMLGDLDDLARDHALQNGARLLSKLRYAYALHGVHLVHWSPWLTR